MGIPSVLIRAIILTHCHADHDAGTFNKLLGYIKYVFIFYNFIIFKDENRIELITTRTIMSSFLRKYTALSGMSIDELKDLFVFRPVTLGTLINIYGC